MQGQIFSERDRMLCSRCFLRKVCSVLLQVFTFSPNNKNEEQLRVYLL